MRIVSLLPSATEIVCALGREDLLVGVTHECDYPPSVQRLPSVTRTLIPAKASSGEIDRLVREQLKTTKALYQLDLPLLKDLRPDVIVTQSLCDVCAVSPDEVQAALSQLPGPPRVINLEPRSIEEVFDAIRQVASAASVSADELIRQLQGRLDAVAARSARMNERLRVIFLEWLDPPFSCGHWNSEIVRIAGGVEGFGTEREPSRRLRWDEIVAWQPEVLFIACCGLNAERALEDVSVAQSVPGWYDMPAVRSGRIYVADGSQYFNRPGPRLVDSLEILAHALYPERHPLPEVLAVPHRLREANSKRPSCPAGERR